jgi:hypothetical protein
MLKIFQRSLSFVTILILVFAAFTATIALNGIARTIPSDINQDIILPLQLHTNKPLYKPGEDISIFVRNIGRTRVNFDTLQKIRILDENGNTVYPTAEIRNFQPQLPTDSFSDIKTSYSSVGLSSDSWSLDPGQMESYLFDQVTIATDELSPGMYTIETVSELPAWMETRIPIIIRDLGYVLLVAGNNNDDMQDRVDEACNRIYDDLKSIGYSDDRIYYLNGWANWRVDDSTSSANMEDAIKVWAADKVNLTSPLFIVMFDHGGDDHFCVDDPPTNDNVWDTELDAWLDDLEEDTNAPVYIYYMACHSGSFIDEISKTGRIMITSSSAGENSGTAPSPYHEKLTSQYWPRIKAGDSLLEAFNVGSHYVAETLDSYHPLLDDNGDGTGHGWDVPDPSGYLPHNGDGGYAAYVYMGKPVIRIPWIGDLVAKKAFEFPIPPEPDPVPIPIIAKIEGLSPIAKVTAVLIPPIIANYEESIILEDVQYQYFDMSDLLGDGTWSVNIPSSVFAEFKPAEFRPAEFKIMVIVEDENGQTAVPGITGVEFTSDGELSPDYSPPSLRIESPKYLDNIRDTVIISAVAMDDTSVEKAEIIIDDIVVGTVNLPESSNYAFEYEMDIRELTDGIHNVQIQIEDTSGNTYSKSTFLTVVNDAIEIPAARFKLSAIAELELAKNGNKKLDKKLNTVIETIKSSLDPDLWQDITHLDPKFGHKVFSMEKHAIMKLTELMNHKNMPDSLINVCENVILKLVNADWLIAKAVMEEAQLLAGTNKQVDNQIASAEQKYQAAFDNIAEENFGSAIDCYRQSWEHAQKGLAAT